MLQVTALPPHAVVVQPEHQSILIASSSPEATAGSAAGHDSSALRSGNAVLPCADAVRFDSDENASSREMRASTCWLANRVDANKKESRRI